MSTPYFTGDGVPLKFTISDATGGITPSAVSVTILKPNNSVTDSVPAGIDENQVSYDVPGSVTDIDGRYRAYFVNTLPSGVERTHMIEFEVIRNPG